VGRAIETVALLCMLVAMLILAAGVGGVAPVLRDGALTWDSSAYTARQVQATRREEVRQAGDTARWQATAQTAQTGVIWFAGAAVLGLAVWQGGITVRHWQEQQSRRHDATCAVLREYIALLLPPAQRPPELQATIEQVNGEWMILDPIARERIPADVAALELRAAKQLTMEVDA
jgi:hypothetical protein